MNTALDMMRGMTGVVTITILSCTYTYIHITLQIALAYREKCRVDSCSNTYSTCAHAYAY